MNHLHELCGNALSIYNRHQMQLALRALDKTFFVTIRISYSSNLQISPGANSMMLKSFPSVLAERSPKSINFDYRVRARDFCIGRLLHNSSFPSSKQWSWESACFQSFLRQNPQSTFRRQTREHSPRNDYLAYRNTKQRFRDDKRRHRLLD